MAVRFVQRNHVRETQRKRLKHHDAKIARQRTLGWKNKAGKVEEFDEDGGDDGVAAGAGRTHQVHVEEFLATLPSLHRRDQAREFFQLSRALVALQAGAYTRSPFSSI